MLPACRMWLFLGNPAADFFKTHNTTIKMKLFELVFYRGGNSLTGTVEGIYNKIVCVPVLEILDTSSLEVLFVIFCFNFLIVCTRSGFLFF